MKEDWRGWLIGALFTLLVLFGGFYFSTVGTTLDALQVNQSVIQDNAQALSERVTTLEESKRNTESLLKEIKSDLTEIKNSLARSVR